MSSRHFTEKDTQMSDNHMKNSSIFLVFGETQIKIQGGISENLQEWLKLEINKQTPGNPKP